MEDENPECHSNYLARLRKLNKSERSSMISLGRATMSTDQVEEHPDFGELAVHPQLLL
jgi:hypothetical protein